MTVVETDHRPLEMIFTKPLYKTPKKLHCILLRLAQYEIQVIYKPGKELFITDIFLELTWKIIIHQFNVIGHLKKGEEKL